MHGGASKCGEQHWNFKTGRHSKVLRKIAQKFNRLLAQPVEVRIALYPDGFVETMEKPWPGALVRHGDFSGCAPLACR